MNRMIHRLSELGYQELIDWEGIYHSKIRAGDKLYDAYRVIHDSSLGPSKGGIRFHPNVTEEELKMLSLLMSLKNSLMELPYGGAKGGVVVDPKRLSREELKELSRNYANAFRDIIGTWKDIPAPDVNTNSQIIAWMLDAYQNAVGTRDMGMFTSKPVELGGIAFREVSTSYGGFVIIDYIAKNIERRNLKIAIQGAGNVGGNLARMLDEAGYKVIAISDSKGGVYNENGLDIADLLAYKQQHGSFEGYRGNSIDNKEILELDVDVLVPAALEMQIGEHNYNYIKAKWIVEMANNPVDWNVDDRLNSIIVPDILANSGGVIGSYMEWVYNITGNYLDEETMKQKTRDRILNKFLKLFSKDPKHMRENAIREAADRIVRARKLRK
ncbi:MAG: Glu/Leu/Phe/Val dehydrogenase [Candidatus Anstonellales archaeon]